MVFSETPLSGVYAIELDLYTDARGSFARSYCVRDFEARGLNPRVAQCNVSHNRSRGTLRGMHYQVAPHEEAKLVRCTRGAMYDVVVDLRPQSSTYLRWAAFDLRALPGRPSTQVYIPPGCAHGFLTLEDDTEVFYQMSEFYAPEAAHGFRWDDPAFGIEWPEPVRLISDRDRTYPDFPLRQAAVER
jgi:dTDP-4-dehydrorhamnose 3,5-epimerase